MEYIYHQGESNQPLFVLLHGTGGNEESLLSIAEVLNNKASILAVRGTVSEHGALRYFKRLVEGLYDVEDLNQRGQELADFIIAFTKEKTIDLTSVVLIGFSNGANIAINLLLADKSPFRKALLMAPMYPVDTCHLTESKDKTKVFISMGKNDPIVTQEESQAVVNLFTDRQAQVETYWVNSHEVTLESLMAAKIWLNK